MSYEKNIVKKPWGYEYLAYENEHVGLWLLYIAYGQSTSMHCHPNKTTGLMIIDGDAEISFLNDKFILKPEQKMMIRKGLFHSTKAINLRGAWVFEIETPVDKHDLVRFKDSYGREGKPYEDNTFEIPKKDDCIWFEEPRLNEANTYDLANCNICIKSVTDTSFFNEMDDKVNIIFLQGGLMTDYNTNVAGPGDIVSSSVIKKLIKVFNNININTMIMTVENRNA